MTDNSSYSVVVVKYVEFLVQSVADIDRVAYKHSNASYRYSRTLFPIFDY